MSKDTQFLLKYCDDTRQLDTEQMVWIQPRVNGNCPTGRYGHSAVLVAAD
jgi:hypothetical protein